MRALLAAGVLGLASLLAAQPAKGNDSEAEIGLGGIELLDSSTLQLISEDLYISPDLVRVEYRFRNPSPDSIETSVAFPMPRQPRGLIDTNYFYEEERQDWSDFGFATFVDGRPVRLRQMDRAMIGERDVTDRIAELGLPLFWIDGGDKNPFTPMSESELAPFLAEGLAVADPLFDGRIVPAWDAVTYFVREQSFPPNAEVSVRHEYVPLAGGSVGGALYPAIRAEYGTLDEYRARYCVDDDLLAGIDKRLAGGKPGTSILLSETWLSYVLSTGANWSGPIETFRLVVDKGSTDNLVSFCMNGVTKIGATQFEVRRRDFEPERDLDILLLRFYELED